tara:strand:- start:156 stop:389 length:234 start_codon:yes stop_codon:yes gene_type:complete
MTRTIWTNRKLEKVLKDNGWNIPEYPKIGKVFLNNKQIGNIDNFSGMTITDEKAIKFLESNNGKLFNVAIWENWNSK